MSPTTVVTVPPGYSPPKNPPPPGSPWAAIDAARKRLDWSARELSKRAVGEKSAGHYTQMSQRGTWNSDLATLDRFIAALVDAGIPENEIRIVPGNKDVPPQTSDFGAPIDTLAMAEQAARWLTEQDKVPPDKAWLMMRGIRLSNPTPIDFYFAARQPKTGNAKGPRAHLAELKREPGAAGKMQAAVDASTGRLGKTFGQKGRE